MLDRLVTSDCRVFEYGSGVSTVYFAQRASSVVSIEHEPTWRKRVKRQLEGRKLSNVSYHLVQPTFDQAYDRARVADPLACVPDDDRYLGQTFRSYASSVEAYPDEHFDLVVVDGRARPSCIMHARSKVRPGGTLLLDQSARRYYRASSLALLERLAQHALYGASATSLHFTEATFFRKERS